MLVYYLDCVLDKVRNHGTHTILAGDFNLHNREWLESERTLPAGEHVEIICVSHRLTQLVNQSTHLRGGVLDLIMTDVAASARVFVQPPVVSALFTCIMS